MLCIYYRSCSEFPVLVFPEAAFLTPLVMAFFALIKTSIPPFLVMSIPASLETTSPALRVIPFPAFFETLFSALFVTKTLTSPKTLLLIPQSFLLSLRLYSLLSSRNLCSPRHWTIIMHIHDMQAALGLALLLADTVRTKAVFAHYMVRSQTPFSPKKSCN